MLTPWTLLPFAFAFLDEVEDGPPQMTSDWFGGPKVTQLTQVVGHCMSHEYGKYGQWDLHYVETLEDIDLTMDPRELWVHKSHRP
eukprot:s2518_g12.t1